MNDGRGAFTAADGARFALGVDGHSVAAADVNRDGRMDLICADVNEVAVFLGARGTFAPAPGSPYGAGPGSYFATLIDLNATASSISPPRLSNGTASRCCCSDRRCSRLTLLTAVRPGCRLPKNQPVHHDTSVAYDEQRILERAHLFERVALHNHKVGFEA